MISEDLLEEVLQIAKSKLPGWTFASLVKALDGKVIPPKAATKKEISRVVKSEGSAGAPIGFVCMRPAEYDLIRKQLLTGSPGKTFNDLYLRTLSLDRDSVWVGCLCPDGSSDIKKWANWFDTELKKSSPKIVVALGPEAKKALGDRADFVLPYPQTTMKISQNQEVVRKSVKIIDALCKNYLDGTPLIDKYLIVDKSNDLTLHIKPKSKDALAAVISENRDRKETLVWSDDNGTITKYDFSTGQPASPAVAQICKAHKAKQIVYGIVADPYGLKGAEPDLHEDWIAPSAIESDAHQFSKGKKVIGLEHMTKANAELVESSLMPYPSPEDYQKAMDGEDHSIWRMPFGDDFVHSGSWVVAVRLGDSEWKKHLSGKLNAFSPGGVGRRVPMDKADLPKVKIIELVPKVA